MGSFYTFLIFKQFERTERKNSVLFFVYFCKMKDLLIVYAGVYATLISSNFHIFVSNLLAITTIIYTLIKLYLMYQEFKNKNQ